MGQTTRTGPMRGPWDSGARGEGQEDGGQKGIWGRQGMSVQRGYPLLRVGVWHPPQKGWCWAGEHKGEGIGRNGTSKPTDIPSPLQARSPTTAPGKAVAGNLPALMS